MTRAFITGITGQDGSYLAELLIGQGYDVHGLARRSSTGGTSRIDHLSDGVTIHQGDMTDGALLSKLIRDIRPDEVYNLAAQSHVHVSFRQPAYTAQATGVGTLHLLDAVLQHAPNARFYQASSSEMFGQVAETPQRETTPFHPRSPYGCAKVYAHWQTVNMRESYGLHASCGILFNHESPRRGEEFVTRKIARGVADIWHGRAETLRLGNLDAKRDWGFAGDYVRAMWHMLQQEEPGDYVIATGETHTVREFCELAFAHAGLDYTRHVIVDRTLFRPAEVDILLGDASKARAALGWKPRVSFDQLVRMMVDAELVRSTCPA